MEYTYIPGQPIPENTTHLNCIHLQLRELPELPPTLRELYCYENQLTELPALPPNLRYLSCDSDIYNTSNIEVIRQLQNEIPFLK
jgi:Leucine-rich repeat (LRR) protein